MRTAEEPEDNPISIVIERKGSSQKCHRPSGPGGEGALGGKLLLEKGSRIFYRSTLGKQKGEPGFERKEVKGGATRSWEEDRRTSLLK